MKDKIIFAAVLLLLLGVAFFIGRRVGSSDPEEVVVVKTDTLTIHDTIRFAQPVYIKERVVDTMYVPVVDTLALHDTTFIMLPRTQREYIDSLYHAWVSGYKPQLDSIEVFQKTEYITTTVTVHDKPKRFGIGVQAGVGAWKEGFYPYFGIGVSYNIFNF